MSPSPHDPLEAEGVLNPASGRTEDGALHLLPRLVAGGNVSRVGLAEVTLTEGVPTGVTRRGVVLAPDAGWERGKNNAGVEDPRVTWIPSLGQYVMSYVAYGPLGPRAALAVSADLRTWRRIGPVQFAYQPDLDTDLNLFPNKDVVHFPVPVPGPDGAPAYAMLHRPMWDLGWFRPGEGVHLPAGVTDERPGIWISYVPVAEAEADITALTRPRDHRLVALSEHPWESLKIGAGPAPVQVEEGWLLIHHGVSGRMDKAFTDQQQHVSYAAGAMILDPADPARVLARSAEPLMAPETEEERSGTVPNVVFPTAVEEIDGVRYVFYGMADAHIGVARLERTD
ncbi:glycosidase [Streptomyces abyssalis]|uniref:Glycosidase n=1 Tax=Streptomyces abyssalis TaxID=933944 RepID=A0A1E7JTI3_9ACTN|nr:glycosidase [Streptomyces abyssalis]OEU92215.1 glycosidase [Streptomyces abyssalis]OEU94342.1 glycosidase [Streptomyces abyssalis]OEV06574.1 glycosidase [Streptomyces nanshensis]